MTPIALAIEPRSQVDWSPSLTLLLLYLGIAGTGVACWAAATASRLLPAVTTSLGLLATPTAAIALVLGGVAIGATDRGRGDRASGLTGPAPSRILPP